MEKPGSTDTKIEIPLPASKEKQDIVFIDSEKERTEIDEDIAFLEGVIARHPKGTEGEGSTKTSSKLTKIYEDEIALLKKRREELSAPKEQQEEIAGAREKERAELEEEVTHLEAEIARIKQVSEDVEPALRTAEQRVDVRFMSTYAEELARLEGRREDLLTPSEKQLRWEKKGLEERIAEIQAKGPQKTAEDLLDMKSAQSRLRDLNEKGLELIAEEMKSGEVIPIPEEKVVPKEEQKTTEAVAEAKVIVEVPKEKTPAELAVEAEEKKLRDESEVRKEQIAELKTEVSKLESMGQYAAAASLKESLSKLQSEEYEARNVAATKREETAKRLEVKEGEASPELKALAQQKELIAERAKEKGQESMVRRLGDWYKGQPLKRKLLWSLGFLGLSAGSALIGGAAGAAVAGAALTGSAIQRTLGGMATFVSVEALLKSRVEQGEGRERTDWEARRHTVLAGILGVMVGTGMVGAALRKTGEGIAAGARFMGDAYAKVFDGDTAELGARFAGGGVGRASEAVVTAKTEAGVSAATEIAGETITIQEGDNMWKIIKEQMAGSLEGKTTAEKNFIVDSFYKKLAGMSPEQLKEMGIVSGKAALIHPGEQVNLSALFDDKGFEGKVLATAESLPQAEELVEKGVEVEPEISGGEEALGRKVEVVGEAAKTVAESSGLETPSATDAEAIAQLKREIADAAGKQAGELGPDEHALVDKFFPSKGFYSGAWDKVKDIAAEKLRDTRPTPFVATGDPIPMAQKLIGDLAQKGFTPRSQERLGEFVARAAEALAEKK